MALIVNSTAFGIGDSPDSYLKIVIRAGGLNRKAYFAFREASSIKPIKGALVRYTENERPGRFGC